MASNILKNNIFDGPTYFDRRWATCLGSRDKRAELGWPSSRGEKGGPPSVKEAHVYLVLRYSTKLTACRFCPSIGIEQDGISARRSI